MIRTLTFVVIMTICGLSFADLKISDPRIKRAENGFILRSCQASVQLNRKYRTNPDTNALKVKSQAAEYPRILNENVARRLKFGDRHPAFNGRMNTRSRETRNEKDTIHDTPFKTIDIKSLVKDSPQIFKKKDSLPQLNSALREKIDTEPTIIIVEKVY